jgi:hypothetical protein
MSNAGALEAAADTIAAHFAAHPDYRCFSFSPPDEPVLCHCPECRKATSGSIRGEGYGELSDAYFPFVFRLASEVGRRCPGHWITSMAYYNRCRPPVQAAGRQGNLLMYLASIQQCAVHSYGDQGCWSRQVFAGMLRRWSELSAGLIYYEYDPHDWSMLQRPTWRSGAIADDFCLLKSVGGWGFNDEGQIAWLSTGLNYYVRARLGWNGTEDPAALVRDFTVRFFGPAAPPMLRYYTTMEDALRGSVIDRPDTADYVATDARGSERFQPVWDQRTLARCARMLEDAAGRAASEPWRGRVAAFRAQFDRLVAYAMAWQAMARGDYQAAADHGQQMIQAVGRLSQPALLVDHGPLGKGAASGETVLELAKRLSARANGPEGKLVSVLPDAADFRTDPTPEGVVMGWFRPETEPVRWRRLRMTGSWQSQGVVGAECKRYAGVAWYRVRARVPALAAQADVRLMVPAFRGQSIAIWCNGAYAGMVERKTAADASVSVTAMLRSGDNAFAFRVTGDDGGGIMAPPFLYTPLVASAR